MARNKEAFIRQGYQPGSLCEFDWGEVKIRLDGKLRRYYLAVFTSAFSNYRYALLFQRQDSLAFKEAHICFFDHVGGVYHEMLYDNMRVAIAQFVGKTEKLPTESLKQLSRWYQYQESRFSIPEEELTHLLAETLSVQADGTEVDLEEARIVFGEDEATRSRKYILSWVQKRILQDLPDTEGNTQYQLSAYTEKVFQWMTTLQLRQHVGTESRFRLLFTSLRDIVENTEDDHSKKLEILRNRKAEIDKEIKALEHGVLPDRYSTAQVQERLELFTRLCYELISDFREVEDNFKQIHRAIVEQHIKAEQTKGAIVGFAFGAYDALRTSNQGKSFYAFWDFLISRPGQDDWRELTEQLVQLLLERDIPADRDFLQNVKSLLLQQGTHVYQANDRMAEKLSRIITEKEIARHRRLRRQINQIKEMAFELIDEETIDCGIVLDSAAEIKMPMDRRLTSEPKKSQPTVRQPTAAAEKIEDMERFSRLLNATHINKKQLWQKVETTLQHRQTATLKEVLETTGLDNGLAEVVSYYNFLRDKGGRAQVIGGATELIPLDAKATKYIEVPYLLFAK